MKVILKLSIVILIFLIMFGCSTENEEASNFNNLPNITTIHAPSTNGSIYISSIDAKTKEVITTNLSEELSIQPNWSYWTVIEDKISFIKRFPTPSIWQKNILTGETIIKENYYQPKENAQPIFSTNSKSKLLNFYLQGPYQNGTDAYLDVTDINTDITQNIYIDKLDFVTGLVAEDKIILKTENNARETALILVDLINGTIVEKLSLGQSIIKFATISESELYVFLDDNILYIYNMSNLELLQSQEYDISFVGPTFNVYPISGNKMAYTFPHVQPSPLGLGPAIYNFETKESKFIMLFNVLNFLVQELGTNIQIGTFKVDLDKERIVVGFNRDFDLKGGIAFLNFEGEVIDYILLDYYPSDIILEE